MNKYLKNLSKIEFVVTSSCTGKCKHCSQGDHEGPKEEIDPAVAADAVRRIAAEYDIKTVMAFGGEPLLHREATYSIMNAAREINAEKRQVITNGYFSKDPDTIKTVAKGLFECGVNDLILSVDTFHEESIPPDVVKIFAKETKALGIPIRLQPAWLVSRNDQNPYNMRTREILDSFADLGIAESEGNIIFPEGNALKYLSEYFADTKPENPYEEDARDVRCVSFAPNGDVLDGNVYKKDIMDIIRDYTP